MWRARVREGGIVKNAYRRRRDEAVEAEKELREQIERELRPETADPRKEETPTFAVHWAEYLRDVGTAKNKPSTIREKEAAYRNHLGPFFGKLKLDTINVRLLDRFKAELLAKVSPKTVNNILTVLRHALTVAAERSKIQSVPFMRFARVEKPKFRFLDFDEAEWLRAGAEEGPLAHAMVTVALNTGLRIGELRALSWQAVDLRAGRLHVREAASRTEVTTPKNGRAREAPLNETAIAALRSLKRTGAFVFGKPDGTMLTRQEADTLLARAQRRSGLKGFGWHALRHTFASHLVMRGVALKTVQDLLGHADIQMTMRYAHLAPRVAREAVRVLDATGPTGGPTLGL